MPDDQQKIELEKREQNKRVLVEKEIEASPMFKALKTSAKETNIPLDIETIVDKYFEYSPDSANNFQNQDFYKVDSDLITYVLNQTIYLISVTENGVILNPDGTVDHEGSEMQAKVMAGIATPEEKKELYSKLTSMNKEDNIKDFYLNGIKLDKFLDSIYGMTDAEREALYRNKEFQADLDESANKMTDKIMQLKLYGNIENEEQLKVITNCRVLSGIFEKENLTDNDKRDIAKSIAELKQLADQGEEWAKEIIGAEGSSNEEIIARAIRESEEYIRKEHAGNSLQILQKGYGLNKELLHFYKSEDNPNGVPDERKKEILEAAIALYAQPEAEYTQEAIRVFQLLNLVTKDPKLGIVPDKEKIAHMYSGITGKELGYLEILRQTRSDIESEIDLKFYRFATEAELGQFKGRTDAEYLKTLVRRDYERKAEIEAGKENENERESNVPSFKTVVGTAREEAKRTSDDTDKKTKRVTGHNKKVAVKEYVKEKDRLIEKKLDKMLGDLDYKTRISVMAIASDYVRRQYKDSQESKYMLGYINRHKRQYRGIDRLSMEEHMKVVADNPSLYRALNKMKIDPKNPEEEKMDFIGRNILEIVSKESSRKLGLVMGGLVGSVKDFIEFQNRWLASKIEIGKVKCLEDPTDKKVQAKKEQFGYGEKDFENEVVRKLKNLQMKSMLISGIDISQVDSEQMTEDELYNFYLNYFDEEKARQFAMEDIESRNMLQKVKESGEKSLSQEEIDAIVAREMAAQADPTKSTTRTIEESEAAGDMQLPTGEIVPPELIENIMDVRMQETKDLEADGKVEDLVAPIQGIIEASNTPRENANKTTTNTSTKENYKQKEIKEDKEFDVNAPTNEFDRLYKVDITPTATVAPPAKKMDDKAYIKAGLELNNELGGSDKKLSAALLEGDVETIAECLNAHQGIVKDNKEQPVAVMASGDER